MLLDGWPYGHHCSVGKKAHYDAAPFAGLLDAEEGLAGYPAVSHSLVVGLAWTLAYNDIEAVVLQVERLARALNAIAEHGDGLILEHFSCLFYRKLFAGHYILFDSAKIDFCHNGLNFNYLTICFHSFPPSCGDIPSEVPVFLSRPRPFRNAGTASDRICRARRRACGSHR